MESKHPNQSNQTSTPFSPPIAEDKKKLVRLPPPVPSKLVSKFNEMIGNVNAPAVMALPSKSDANIPTFAKLTAEIAIKNSAEIALSSLLCNESRISSHGFFHGTVFQELEAAAEIAKIQKDLLKQSFSNELQHLKKFIRYFGYQNRIIFGFLEIPSWGLKEEAPSQLRESGVFKDLVNPRVLIVIRDATGKHAWVDRLYYGDPDSLMQQKSSVSKSFPNLFEFTPHPFSCMPKDSSVVKLTSHNESSIPRLNDLFKPGSPERETFDSLKDQIESQSILELEMRQSNR